MRYLFGVDVGGTTVKLGFFDADGNLLDKWEIPTRKPAPRARRSSPSRSSSDSPAGDRRHADSPCRD